MTWTKEKRRTYYREWRRKNPDKVKARNKKWKEENPEKVKAYHERYKNRHPDKVKAARERFKEGHPERLKALMKKWRKKHPNYSREHRIIERFGDLETYYAALNKNSGLCACGCGRKANCVHHKDGRSIRNSPLELVDNRQSNLMPMNKRCHDWFHALKVVRIFFKVLRGEKF